MQYFVIAIHSDHWAEAVQSFGRAAITDHKTYLFSGLVDFTLLSHCQGLYYSDELNISRIRPSARRLAPNLVVGQKLSAGC